MENPKITNYGEGSILLGDNQFETGLVTLAASGKVTNGALLARNSDGKFEVVTATSGNDTQTPVAVYVGETITNTGANAADFSIRTLISGRVKAGALTVGETAATAAQLDMVRSYGIVPVKVTEVNKLDNQ